MTVETSVPCRNQLCRRPLTNPKWQAIGMGRKCAIEHGLIPPPRPRVARAAPPSLLDLIPKETSKPMTVRQPVEQAVCRQRTPEESAAVQRAIGRRQRPAERPAGDEWGDDPDAAVEARAEAPTLDERRPTADQMFVGIEASTTQKELDEIRHACQEYGIRDQNVLDALDLAAEALARRTEADG